MALEIPLFVDANDYTMEVQLDGTTYQMRLHWNERATVWFLDLFLPTNGESIPVCLSCPCVLGYPLTLGTWTNAPPGQLVVIGRRDPERFDWGVVSKLVYITGAEIAEMAGDA